MLVLGAMMKQTDYEHDGVCASLWLDVSKALCRAVVNHGPLPTRRGPATLTKSPARTYTREVRGEERKERQ